MLFELKITAATPVEFADAILNLQGLLKSAAPAAPAAEPEQVEQPEETKKPRGRKRQEPVTIDHDPNEVKNDVRTDAGGDNVASLSGDAGAADRTTADSAAEPVDRSAGGATKDEPAPEVDAVAETPAEPSLTIDEVRAYMINNYLNVVTDDLPKRKDLYKELLNEFSIEKIVDLSADKIGAFKAAVDAKIAAAVKA